MDLSPQVYYVAVHCGCVGLSVLCSVLLQCISTSSSVLWSGSNWKRNKKEKRNNKTAPACVDATYKKKGNSQVGQQCHAKPLRSRYKSTRYSKGGIEHTMERWLIFGPTVFIHLFIYIVQILFSPSPPCTIVLHPVELPLPVSIRRLSKRRTNAVCFGALGRGHEKVFKVGTKHGHLLKDEIRPKCFLPLLASST